MLRNNSLRAKLDAQPVVLGTFVEIPSPAVVEILGAAGFDFCVIDTEHGSFGLAETESLIRASASTAIAPVVRVASCDAVAVRQPLDMGAAGIHIPQIESAQMARDAIRYARFHPLGERGLQPYVRAAGYGTQPLAEFLVTANREAVVVVHLEGTRALAELDEILSIEGLDVLFVGPYDLSQSMGMPGQVNHPLVREKVAAIIAAALKAGKRVGTFCGDVSAALEARDAGVSYLTVGMDANLLLRSAAELVQGFRG